MKKINIKSFLLLLAIVAVQVSKAQNTLKTTKLNISKLTKEKIVTTPVRKNFYLMDCILLDLPNKEIPQNESAYYVCGIAYSKTGSLAVSYINKNDNGRQAGKVKIWNEFDDFYNGRQPIKTHVVYNPEALAFDSNSNLYIASTVDNKIVYFLKSDNWNSENSFVVMANKVNPTSLSNPWNARGINFDESDNLYIMCENLHCNNCAKNQVFPASVVKVTNPSSTSRTINEIQGSSQEKEQALGVAVGDGKMFTTDLNSNKINMYSINGDSVILNKSIKVNFIPLDIIYSKKDNTVYFTCVENSVSKVKKWNFETSTTTDDVKTIANNADYPSSWGLAFTCDKLIVADGVNDKVIFFKR